MEAQAINKALVLLAQEVAHWHLIHGADTMGAVELRLRYSAPIENEKNISLLRLDTTDIIDFMSRPKLMTPTTIIVEIQEKIRIISSHHRDIEITQRIEAAGEYHVYNYERLLTDINAAIGTGKQVDLNSYDITSIIKDIEAVS